MIGGFTFDGVDIADLHLEYVPDLGNTYVYKPATFKIHEQVFEGHDGGYYYGNTTQPKEFVLRCAYEDQHILNGIMTRLFDIFKRGRTGLLVFKKRPWCWYVATVTNVDINQMVSYQNGIVTINMKAYYPFARTYSMTIPANSTYAEDMLNNSAMLYEGRANLQTSFATPTAPITSGSTVWLYNPGTERAKVAIRIAGDVGTGVRITNRTTGQSCKFVGITSSTVPGNQYVQSDSLNGQTIVTDGSTSELGFLYHDEGFIDLEPGYPAYRDIMLSITDNRNVHSEGQFTPDMVGRVIHFADMTKAKIVRVDNENNVQVDANVSNAQNGRAQIIKMNEIAIQPSSVGGDFSLKKLEFVYQPTFA